MANEFPTSPEVLGEASAFSLSDLALMSPAEMGPSAEMAYINELRAYRERYERALGAKGVRAKPGASTKAAPKTSLALLDVAFGDDSDGGF